MRQLYFITLLIIFICCPKNTLEKPEKNLTIIDFSNFSVKIDSAIISSYKNQNLTAFYKNYDNETVWTSQENRTAVLDELKNTASEGLLPNGFVIIIFIKSS